MRRRSVLPISSRFSWFRSHSGKRSNYYSGLAGLFCFCGIMAAYRRREDIQFNLLHYHASIFNFVRVLPPVDRASDELAIQYHRLPQSKNTPIWLMFTGAFNPPHPGHILGAVMAMRQLKALGYEDVHIAIYPSNDDYVSCKSDNQGRSFLQLGCRVQLVRHLIQTMSGLTADERKAVTVFSSDNESDALLDCNQRDIALGLQARFGQEKSVVYLVGQDVYDNLRELYECDQMPCVVMPRVIGGLSSTKLLGGEQETVDAVERYASGYHGILNKMYEYQAACKGDVLGMRVMEAYEDIYKHGYEEDEGRGFHDIRHISRVTFYIRTLYTMYHENGLTQDVLSNEELNLLEIAAIYHDAGRQADGPDYWDEDSATLFYRFCIDRLHVEPLRAKTFAEVMMNKDYQPDASLAAPLKNKYWEIIEGGDGAITWREQEYGPGKKTLAQKILHDADCIDIQRIPGLKFNKAYLDIHQAGFKWSDRLIAEVQKLIEAHGSHFEATEFSDGLCYVNTVQVIKDNFTRFPLFYAAYFGSSNHVIDNRSIRAIVEKTTTLQFDEPIGQADIIRTVDGKIFVQYGRQLGSNAGGFFVGHDSVCYYIKFAPVNNLVLTTEELELGLSEATNDVRRRNRTRFQNEYLMGQLYRLFDMAVPQTNLIFFKKAGVDYVGITSKFESDLIPYETAEIDKKQWKSNKDFLRLLQCGGLVDFLLGDNDAVGCGRDNVFGKINKVTGEVEPMRIDPGAGLLFTATGMPLDLKSSDVSDFLTDDLQPGSWWGGFFGETFDDYFHELLTNFAVLSSAIQVLEKVSPEELTRTIRRHGYDSEALTDRVIDLVLRRREALLKITKRLECKLKAKISQSSINRSQGFLKDQTNLFATSRQLAFLYPREVKFRMMPQIHESFCNPF